MGGRTPKQFLRLTTAPVLVLTATHFLRHPRVSSVVVAVPAASVGTAQRLLAGIGARKPVTVVPGGPERQDSVSLGLAEVSDADVVIVHDAVRPFVTARLIDAVLEGAGKHGAAICALPIHETVKRVVDGMVEATLDRRTLRVVQTPQAFQTALLREAHDKARRDAFVGTDDAMLVERLGHVVAVVPGLPENVKITTPVDLRLARARARRESR